MLARLACNVLGWFACKFGDARLIPACSCMGDHSWDTASRPPIQQSATTSRNLSGCPCLLLRLTVLPAQDSLETDAAFYPRATAFRVTGLHKQRAHGVLPGLR